jgi:hypothetical protein
VPQSRSGRSGEHKILALMGSNLADQHAYRRCTKGAIAISVMIVKSNPVELSTS